MAGRKMNKKHTKSNFKRKLAICMAMILVLSMIGNYPIVVKAEEDKVVTFTLSCSGDNVPDHAELEIACKGADESNEGDYRVNIDGTNDKTTDTVSVSINGRCEKVLVRIQPAGRDIIYNENVDNSWDNWKTISVVELAESYNFILDCSNDDHGDGGNGGDEGGPTKSDITDDMWQWDTSLNVYKYVIDSDEKVTGINDIYVPTNKLLIIDKNYTVPGELNVGIFGTLQINKNCTLSGNVNMDNLSKLILGNSTSASGFDTSKLKVKKTGDGNLYDFDLSKLDNTEFIFIDGNYIYYDGPDCGFNFNSNETVNVDGIQRGYVDYVVKNGNTEVCRGTFDNDWQEQNVSPDDFKAGTVIEFTVHINDGFVLQSNGVRFPDNKNTISDIEDENDGDSTVTCSYTLTETPEQFLTLTIDFIEAKYKMNYAEFYWSYDSVVTQTEDGFGKYVEHGRIEIVSVTKDGSSVTKGTIDNPPYWSSEDSFENRSENQIQWQEKVALFEPGSTVIARLVPDRGYQLTSFRISNIPNTTRAVDGVNEYTFEISRPDFYHLSAVFSPVEDKVDSSATGITGGAVSFAGNEIENGSMALYVTDASPSSEEINTFNEMAAEDGYKIDKCISLTSEQRFYKAVENASRSDCWVINKSELSAPAEISLDVSDLNGSEIEVLHNHNGNYEVIPATFSNGTVTFRAQSFSDFAIVSKGDKPVIPEKPEENDKKTSNSSSSSNRDKNAESTTEEIIIEETAIKETKLVTDDIGMIPSGAPISNWQELEKTFLSMPAITTPLGAPMAAKTPLVQLILKGNRTTVPAEVFTALSKSNSMGLHLFLGNATAITFMNNRFTNLQRTVDVSCVTMLNEEQRVNTISFNSCEKLGCLVYLHTLVPAGTKAVTVYFTGADGVRVKYGTFTPLATGHTGFQITELGRYDIVY